MDAPITPPVPFTGAVLTGGRSVRMGTDKAFVVLRGSPMAAYPLAALHQAGAAEVLAIGGASARLAALGFNAVDEGGPGRGPLGAIARALEVAAHDLVAVVACDLPLITAPVIAALLAAAGESAGQVGAVAVIDGRLQPVLAVYHRRLAPDLRAALAVDGAAHRAIAGLGLRTVDLDGSPATLNVNTAADLAAAERLMGT